MLLAHTLQVMVAWAMPCKIQVRKHRSSLPRCFFFPNIPESDNQCISLLRDVPGLCRGPAALQWLLAAEAETFGAIQRAPSASFLPRFSHHWEKPFQDLEKRGLFYKLEESKYVGKDKTVSLRNGQPALFLIQTYGFQRGTCIALGAELPSPLTFPEGKGSET